MDKFFIEERDARLLLKLAEARSFLSKRQRRYTSRRKRPWVVITLLVALVIGFGYFLYRPGSTEIHTLSPSTADSVQKTIAKPEQEALAAADSPVSAPAAETGVGTKAHNTTAKPTGEAFLPDQPDLDESAGSPVQAEPEVSTVAEGPASEPQRFEHALAITRFSACKGVKDREVIGETNTFCVENDRRVYIWMEVSAKSIPCGLRHTYYHNGLRYCEVPLAIKYPRMRTWSFITLPGPDSIGFWQVEIADDNGNILKRVEFNVLP